MCTNYSTHYYQLTTQSFKFDYYWVHAFFWNHMQLNWFLRILDYTDVNEFQSNWHSISKLSPTEQNTLKYLNP